MERISYADVPKGMFEKLMELEQMVNSSSLDIKLLEIIRLRVAQINGCAYCVDMHYKELKHANETELRLHSLCVWKDTPYFDEKERAALAFTEELTNIGNGHLQEATYENLLHYFDKEQISLLTLAITQINTWTRMMITFQFIPGNYAVQQ